MIPGNRTLHKQIADALFALGTPVNAFETYESVRAHREEQAGAVLGVVRQAIRAQPGAIIEGEPPEAAYKRAIDGVLALFPEEQHEKQERSTRGERWPCACGQPSAGTFESPEGNTLPICTEHALGESSFQSYPAGGVQQP